MKELSLEKMEKIQAKGWIDALGCAAGITLVIASATTPAGGVGNILAFATGVEAIDEFCGYVL